MADESAQATATRPATVGAIVIFCLCLAAYATTLAKPFLFDDFPFIVNEPAHRSLANIPSFFQTDQHLLYRPLRSTAYALMYAVFELDPLPYRLASIALHALCSMLIAGIVWSSSASAGAAFLAGLVFAVHPVHADRVANTTASFDLVGLVFGIAGLLALIRYLRDGRNSIFVLGSMLLALGLLGNEECVTIPALLLAWWWCFGHKFPRRRALVAVTTAACVALAYLIVRTIVLGQVARTGIAPVSPLIDRLGAGAIAWWYGALKTAFPFSLRPAYGFTVTTAPKALVVVAIPAWCALFYALWRRRADPGLPGFAAMWGVISFLPFAQIIPTDTVMAERYLYAPLGGFAFLAAWVYDRAHLDRDSSAARSAANALAALCLIVMAFFTAHRGHIWSDEARLWADAYGKDDKAALTVLNHANALMRSGDIETACELFPRAIGLDPYRNEPHVGLGECRVRRGEMPEALAEFQKAHELAPGARGPLEGLCQTLAMTDRFEPAGECAKRLLEIDPDSLVGSYVVGYSAWRQGRRDEALRALETAARSGRGPENIAHAAADLLARIRTDATP